MKKYLTLLLMMPILLWAQTPPAAVVSVKKAEGRLIAATSTVPARLHAAKLTEISAETGAVLVSVRQPGEFVQKGETIASLRQQSLGFQANARQADLSAARARLAFLQSEEKRYRKLETQQLASEGEFERIQSEVKGQRLVVEALKFRLEQEQDRLLRTHIRAPFDGVILEKLAEVGEWMDSGQPIVRFMEQGRKEVRASVPLVFLPYVKHGQELVMSFKGETYMAMVEHIVPGAKDASGRFELRATLDTALPHGLAVKLEVPASSLENRIMVPRDALVLRGSGISVYRVNAESKAEKISVETGIADGEWIEVKSGLGDGDQVVVRGNERLADGQAVKLQ